MSPTVGILGFGRFGALWADILKDDFNIAVSDVSKEACQIASKSGHGVEPAQQLLQRDVLFYAVPISSFKQVLSSHLGILGDAVTGKLFIDVLSVKVHPKHVFNELLPSAAHAMLTHPLFGPDSVTAGNLLGHRLVIDKFRASDEEFSIWRKYFEAKGLEVLLMSAEEHDKRAAESQGLTHAIGRTLGEFGISVTPIDTLGARKLMEVKDQVCNDTWELFKDLQTYNPFTAEMRERLGIAQRRIFSRLLPERVFTEKLVIGLQGGPGSFNEEAARIHLEKQGNPAHELKYHYTTSNVLQALDRGEIDIGQFAVCNSSGGIVHESMKAMGQHTFTIAEDFSIPISHALMIRKDARLEDIDTVMAHPQALRQCQARLKSDYKKVKLVSGEGSLIDASEVAQRLGKGELGKNIATLGCRVLADIYGLSIVREGLQDSSDNRTTFVWVRR